MFWLLLLASASLFWIRQHAIEEESSRVEKMHRDRASELLETVKTMPPQGFLKELGARYMVCDAILREEPGTTAEMMARIRRVLYEIAELASHFDDEAHQANYGANLMRVYDPRDLSSEEISGLERDIKFVDALAGIGGGKRILQLDCRLSASTSNANPENRDSELQELVLVVPQKPMESVAGELRWDLAPGAPYSYVVQDPQVFFSIHEVESWLQHRCALKESIRERIIGYFRSNQDPVIQSFYSHPLTRDEGGDDEESPSYILNVHKSTTAIFRNSRDGMEQFAAVSRPFRVILLNLLARL